VGETVSKKTILILTGATAVAVISAMFIMGSFKSEFDKRLEEVSKIRFILPAGETVESHIIWAERECAQITGDLLSGRIYTSTLEQWHYDARCAPSWSWFKDVLLNALASGEFVGDYIYYDKASKTMWFSALETRTFPELASPLIAKLWTTHYITIE